MEVPDDVKSNHWFINILVEDPESLEGKLRKANIGSRRFFYPLHRQPCFVKDVENSSRSYPISDWLFDHGLSLPSSVILTDEELSYVTSTVLTIVKDRVR